MKGSIFDMFWGLGFIYSFYLGVIIEFVVCYIKVVDWISVEYLIYEGGFSFISQVELIVGYQEFKFRDVEERFRYWI